MSFKGQVVQDGDRFVLPQIKTMKCDAVAYLGRELFEGTDEQTWRQVYQAASYPGAKAVYLMPDCHMGSHVPIGGVIVTEDTIAQAGSGYDISCFTGDTKVSLVDGRTLTFQELVDHYGKGGEFYVYSVTPEGQITTGLAHSPRKTTKAASLVEVRLDNGEAIRCTPDHEWMLRDGTYKKAENLQTGESLMPLYRSYDRGGYCDVIHPGDRSKERMYKASFREVHRHVPEWPKIIHHGLFMDGNPNPSKTNDDPRFLREMDQDEHLRLHAETARERAKRGEIGWGRLHQLRPEQMSQMSSRNMTRLHQDPDFCERRDSRAAKMNRQCREAGKYNENWAGAGKRGRGYLITYNQSGQGREQARRNGTANKGRVHSPETRAKLKAGHAKARKEIIECPYCGRQCKGKAGYGRHLYWSHNNHKVLAVKPLNEREDVFCLTVEKYGNFALDAGVFVHNCGVLYLKVPGMHASAVADPALRKRWIDEIELRVATGIGSHQPPKMASASLKLVEEVLRFGAKPLGVDPRLCERPFIPVEEAHFKSDRVPKALSKAVPQLGSLGGGNHFIEMQVDPEDASVWLMIHTGSRGYGFQTAEHYFFAGAEHRGLQRRRREESWLGLSEKLGQEFWAHHNSAANYAIANRWAIVQGVTQATEKVFKQTPRAFYEISHNLAQEETLWLPDGTTAQGIVHRKGATRAFPAKHPSLWNTPWYETGHPVLIPGSMLHGAAILTPLEGARENGCSVNHGSGRVMGRKDAKRDLRSLQKDIDQEMGEAVVRCQDGTEVLGIVTNSERTPLDECAHVYKLLDDVLEVLTRNNIARIDRRMYPVANLKGLD